MSVRAWHILFVLVSSGPAVVVADAAPALARARGVVHSRDAGPSLFAVQNQEPSSHLQHKSLVSFARRLLTDYRLVAFTSEFGESLRPLIDRWKVNATYGVSWLYVLIDVIVRTIEARLAGSGTARTLRSAIQASVFHTIATMAIPAIIIHSVVHHSTHLLHALKLGESAIAGWGPTALGLILIPAMPLFDPPVEVAVEGVFKRLWRIPEAASHHSHRC